MRGLISRQTIQLPLKPPRTVICRHWYPNPTYVKRHRHLLMNNTQLLVAAVDSQYTLVMR